MKSLYGTQNPASTYARQIAIYDGAFKGKNDLRQVVLHELGHTIYDELSNGEKDAYSSAAGWKNSDSGNTKVLSRANVLREYSRQLPDEDFADNIAGYLIDPVSLKQMSSEVFDWIKKKFGQDFYLRKPCNEK